LYPSGLSDGRVERGDLLDPDWRTNLTADANRLGELFASRRSGLRLSRGNTVAMYGLRNVDDRLWRRVRPQVQL
jgi:hypothetical protein